MARNDVYARFVQGEQKRTGHKEASSDSVQNDRVDLEQSRSSEAQSSEQTAPQLESVDWNWLAQAKSGRTQDASPAAPTGQPARGKPPSQQPVSVTTPPSPEARVQLSESDDDWKWLAKAANTETAPTPEPTRRDPDTESWGVQNWSRNYFTQDGTAANYGIESYMDELMHRDEEYYRADQWQWLNQRMDGLEDTINSGPTQIGQLQTHQTSLHNERNSLMSEYNSNLGTLDSLQDRINTLNSEITSLKRGGNEREVEEKLEEVKRLKKEIYEMEKKQERDQAKADRLQQMLDNNEPTYGEPYPEATIKRIREETWDGSEVIRLKYEDLEMAEYEWRNAARYGGGNNESRRRELTSEIADLHQRMVQLQSRQGQIESRIDQIDYELSQVSQEIWDKQNQLLKAKEEWWVREHQRNEKGFSRV